MSYSIVSYFAQIRPLFEDGVITSKPLSSAQRDEAWNLFYQNLSLLRNERHAFFNRFDYSWAFDRSSYSNEFEAHLQFVVLRVLADIPADHPHLDNASNICVRIVNNALITCATHFTPSGKYILVSDGLLHFFRAWVIFALKLIRIGSPYLTKSRPGLENYIFGNYMLNAIIHEESSVAALSRDFGLWLVSIGMLSLNRSPSRLQTRLPRSVFDGVMIQEQIEKTARRIGTRAWRILFAMSDAEVFMICHELAHCLAHTVVGRTGDILGDLGREIEADEGGASLYMIHKAIDETEAVAYPGGPAVFFRLTDLYVSMRIIAEQLRERESLECSNVEKFGRLGNALGSLRGRQRRFRRVIRHYFSEDGDAARQVDDLYLAYINEVNISVAWCRTLLDHAVATGHIARSKNVVSGFARTLGNENDFM